MTRRGLGRGLDALLAGDGEAGGTERVTLDAISPNPYQPRDTFDASGLEELAASIAAHGVIQPLLVTPDSGGGYVLIAGERRWRAARMAGLTQVPVVVRDADPQTMLALAIIENVQRADLDPLEAADGYSRLMDEFGLTQREVGELVGKSRAAVANSMRLLGLDATVRGLIKRGHLSEGHGRALASVEDEGVRIRLAQRAVDQGWTVRQIEAAVKVERSGDPGAGDPAARRGSSPAQDPNVAAALRDLESALGTRVELQRKGDGGRLVIHFYSDEELQTLYDRLTG